jgi:hypothetical protein
MNPDSPSPTPADGPRYPRLEFVTAVTLVLVLLALGGMGLAARWPELAQAAALEVQVWVAVALLTVALALVSVVALLHTRS